MTLHTRTGRRKLVATLAATATAAALALGGCSAAANADEAGSWSSDVLNIDFATYSPLSLIIKDKGWLEATLGDGVTVNWLQSAGSNKANEALRAGAIDVGSTAGSAALLARANGSPIQTIALYDQPEWSAIVVAKDSPITSVAELKGKTIAATKGTDPYFFLVQALDANGVALSDVEVQNLQHADGRVALENGRVDAWAGLDPMMADSEINAGSRLIYRNVDFNTYGFLNARTDFIENHADLAQVVVDAYEKARQWAGAHPEETAQILANAAGIKLDVATKVITERTHLTIPAPPGQKQLDVLKVVGPIFVESGDVASQDLIDDALAHLLNDTFADKADASRIAD
jgi:sulfonate transport system substrate-binding protein